VTTPQESIEDMKKSIDSTANALATKVIMLRIVHERAVERPVSREPKVDDTHSIPKR
jgi:hypothetical protein